MFGSLGFPEILVILLLALMLFGPKRLPEIGRTLGKALGEFRRSTADLKRSIQTEMTLEEMGAESPEKPRRPNVLRDSESSPPQTTPRQAAAPADSGGGEPEAGGASVEESRAEEASDGEPPPPVLTSFDPEADRAADRAAEKAAAEPIADEGPTSEAPARDEER